MVTGSKREQGPPAMSCGKSLGIGPIGRVRYSGEYTGSQGVQAQAAETGSVVDTQTLAYEPAQVKHGS